VTLTDPDTMSGHSTAVCLTDPESPSLDGSLNPIVIMETTTVQKGTEAAASK